MSDRCPECGGVIGGLGDCIECGTCIICYPARCECIWECKPEMNISTTSTYDLRVEWLYWEQVLEGEEKLGVGERSGAQLADYLNYKLEIRVRMAHIDHELDVRGTMGMAEYKRTMTEEDEGPF